MNRLGVSGRSGSAGGSPGRSHRLSKQWTDGAWMAGRKSSGKPLSRSAGADESIRSPIGGADPSAPLLALPRYELAGANAGGLVSGQDAHRDATPGVAKPVPPEVEVEIVEPVPLAAIRQVGHIDGVEMQEEPGGDVLVAAFLLDVNQPVPVQVHVEAGADGRLHILDAGDQIVDHPRIGPDEIPGDGPGNGDHDPEHGQRELPAHYRQDFMLDR